MVSILDAQTDGEDETRRAAILAFNPDGSNRRIFASGIRNTVGFDWHPDTKDMWFTDNGRDNWDPGHNDRPGDELVVAWSQGQVDIWTHQDGALALLRTLPTDFTDLSAVAIQRHPRSPSNIILLGHLAPDQWTVAATDLATGALTPLWTADSNDEPALLTVADLDHDGHDDLAVIPRSFAPVQLLWGGPERTTLGPTIELLPAVASLHAADMDGDGTPELVLASEAGVLAHDLHTRVVGEPVVHVASSALQGLLLADLEGDGRADILRTSDHDLNVTLRAPAGDDRVQLTFNPTWSVLRAAHLDDDEILDLIGLRNGAVTSRLSAPQ